MLDYMAERYVERYGVKFDAYDASWRVSGQSSFSSWVDLDIEFWGFLHPKGSGEIVSDGTRYEHYRRIHATCWPEQEKSYNRWMDELQWAFCNDQDVTIAGAGGTSKSTESAKYGLVWWKAAAHESIVAATSTTLKASKMRIFGRMVEAARDSVMGSDWWGFWNNTHGVLKHRQDSDLFSIQVIPGGSNEESDGNERLKGWHAPRALVILDELQDIQSGITKGCLNLQQSTSEYQVIRIGNPISWFDEMGKAMLPKDGLKTINPDSVEWTGRFGRVIHLDGMKSPNFDPETPNKFPFLTTQARIDKAVEDYGADSLHFWQQIRGFPSPGGNTNSIINDTIFASSSCLEKSVWKANYRWIAGLDPAYGGDRCVLRLAKVGLDIHDRWVIEFDRAQIVPMKLSDNKTVHLQIAEYVVGQCKSLMDPKMLCIDSTGEGKAVLNEIEKLWGLPTAVEFGGSASELPISERNPKPANKEYTSRVAELWYGFRKFMETDQLRGLDVDTIKEFTARRYELVGGRIKIESKDEVKDRLGKSPDLADCAALVTYSARLLNVLKTSSKKNETWDSFAKSKNSVFSQKSAYASAPIA